MPTELLYRIVDEPRPGALARVVVNPFWPMLALMLGGTWLAAPWFALNAVALGSATKRREVLLALALPLGSFALFVVLALATTGLGLPKSVGPYLFLALVVFKLAVGYVIQLTQSPSFELFETFGGRPANGLLVVIVGAIVRTWLLKAIERAVGPVLVLVLA